MEEMNPSELQRLGLDVNASCRCCGEREGATADLQRLIDLVSAFVDGRAIDDKLGDAFQDLVSFHKGVRR